MTAMTRTEQMLPHEDLTLGAEVGFKNPRSKSGLDAKSIAELANSIEAKGLKDPLVVWSHEVDKIVHNVILRGQRRYLAIGKLIVEGRANGLKAGIPIRYSQCNSLAEAEAEALIDESHGERLSTVELAEAMERFKTGDGTGQAMTGKEIAKLINRSETWISRISGAYLKATPELKEAWKAGKVTDEAAKGLAEVKDPKKQVEALEEFVETRSTGDRKDKAKSRAKAVKAAPAKKKGKESKTLRRDAKELDDMLDTLDAIILATAGNPEIYALQDGVRWAAGLISDKKLPTYFHEALKAQSAAEKKAIKVGDNVSWAYQVNGKKLTNLGKVVEVVAASELPKIKGVRDPKPRKWTSYVIEAKGGEVFYPVPGIVEKA